MSPSIVSQDQEALLIFTDFGPYTLEGGKADERFDAHLNRLRSNPRPRKDTENEDSINNSCRTARGAPK